jgi:hypothetical protein
LPYCERGLIKDLQLLELQRLVSVLNAVQDELESNGTIGQLSALAEMAAAAAASQSDAATMSKFADQSKDLQESLEASSTRYLGPSAYHILRQTNFEDLLSQQLLKKVESILKATPFLLAQASDQLKQLAKSTKAKSVKLNALIDTLTEIEPSDVVLPDYELGVLLPTQLVHGDLRSIKDQIEEWIHVFDTVSELTNGSPKERIPLTSASVGSFSFFIDLTPTEAGAWLLLIGGVVKIFTSVLRAKSTREGLSNDGYPKSVLDGMKEHEEKLVNAAKQEVLTSLLERSSGTNEHRRNELEVKVNVCIDWVLKSMNQGVDVEVTANLSQSEDGSSVEDKVAELQKTIEELILDVNRKVLSLPNRDVPLLQLPDRSNEVPVQSQASPNGDAVVPKKGTKRKPLKKKS